jgi:hypothetical protein
MEESGCRNLDKAAACVPTDIRAGRRRIGGRVRVCYDLANAGEGTVQTAAPDRAGDVIDRPCAHDRGAANVRTSKVNCGFIGRR